MFVKQIKNFATEVAAAVAARLLPAGGSINQVLAKTAGTDYAVGWVNSTATTGNMNQNFTSGTGGTNIGSSETSIGTITITPQSATSAILITARMVATKDANTTVRTITARIKRGSTQIGLDCEIRSQGVASSRYGPVVITAIDSTHGTTSSITYTLFALCSTAAASTSDDWEITVVELLAPKGDSGTNGTNGSNADMTRTSTTSIAIGTGSKTFTYPSSSNLGWAVGTRLRVANDASNWMEGVVTAVSSTSVTLNADLTAGTGTLSSWTITIAGERGIGGSNVIMGAGTTQVANTTDETTLVSFTVNSWNTSRPIKLDMHLVFGIDSTISRTFEIRVYIGATLIRRIYCTNNSLFESSVLSGSITSNMIARIVGDTELYVWGNTITQVGSDILPYIYPLPTNGDGHGEALVPSLTSPQTVYIKAVLDYAHVDYNLALLGFVFEN